MKLYHHLDFGHFLRCRKWPKSSHKARIPIILIGLLFTLIVNNALWLRLDRTPLTWDEADHFLNSVSYYRWLWQATPKETLMFYERLPYPPLVGIITHLVFPFVGFNPHAAILFVQSLFALVLILALYGMTNFFCREQEAGVSAGLLVFLYPVIFVAARHYLLDLPLTAMTALAMFLLLRVDQFGSRRDALLLGITLGLGMLTKWTFVCYLALPMLMVLLKMLRSDASERRAQAGLVLLIALLVALPWYAPRLSSDWALIERDYKLSTSRDAQPWTQLSGLLFYPRDLVSHQISPLGFLLFLTGALFFFRNGLTRGKRLILAWLIGSLGTLTLIQYKYPRYAMPYLPAIALITTVGLYQVKRMGLRNGVVTAGIALLIAQYYTLSFAPPLRPRLANLQIFQPEYVENFATYPRPQDWKIDKVLEQLKDTFRQFPAKKRTVFVLSHHEIYNVNTFNCLSNIKDLGIRFIGADYLVDPVQMATNEEVPFILLKEFSMDTFFDVNRERALQAIDLVRSQPSKYLPLHSLYLPDGSMVTLYVKL